MIFILVLHGVSAAKVFAILYANYQVATALPHRYVPAATWIFNISILFANELCNGYKFSDAVSLLLPPQTTKAGDAPTGNWGEWVDSYGGLIPRWEILFNICVLRLISFNFDYYWSLDRRAVSPVEVRSPPPLHSETKLTHFRRKTSIPPTTPSASESTPLPTPKTSASATTSPTSSTPPSTSPAQSSPSTTTSPSNAINSPPSTANAPPSTPSASSSATSPWN